MPKAKDIFITILLIMFLIAALFIIPYEAELSKKINIIAEKDNDILLRDAILLLMLLNPEPKEEILKGDVAAMNVVLTDFIEEMKARENGKKKPR